MKISTELNGTPNYMTASEIWYTKLTPMERVAIVKMFDFKSMTKTFRACINHISLNIEQYA